MYDFLKDKTILITGGTGSFGQRFTKFLLENTEAAKIIIFSRDELKQVNMKSSFTDSVGRLRFFIGDVRDSERLNRAFNGVDFVVHAAALKHVPVLEYNPMEAVKTNILGTQNVINAAIDNGIKKVLLISTDKAANPANLYGATKLCAERLMVSSNVYSGTAGTKFSVVRYGNVLGSRGSLLNIIQEQRKTGEVTITHEDMTRFWITLEQGIQLVMRGLETMHGGEIFIPKVPSMRVKDLLRILAPDCKMRIIGIRPGEKMHEVLITTEEAKHTKEFADHYVILLENSDALCEAYQAGKELKDGFYFSSNTNNDWLDDESLPKLMKLI